MSNGISALVLTSTSRRHRYFASTLATHFDVGAVLAEPKRDYYVGARRASSAVRHHFTSIEGAEEEWFAGLALESAPPVTAVDNLNDERWVSWARECRVNVVCLFGTAILGPGWLAAFPGRIVNLHLGLSPFYRGSATLFWPFANRELEYLGTTVHVATSKVDAGDIVARIDPDLRSGEDYYAITTRLIRDSIRRFPRAVADLCEGLVTPYAQEPVAGRLYRKADFTDEALARALAYVGSGLSQDEIDRIISARTCRYLR